MKVFSPTGAVVAWCLFHLQFVVSLSNVTFYSDDLCSQFLSLKTGPDDGTCTPFPSNAAGFRSFRVTSLDQTCAVTVYGSDIPYCSSATLFLAPFSDCMTATNVSQFSVDCQDYSVAISAVPSVVPSGAPDAPAESSTSTDDEGLSGGVKAGIAVAAAVGGIAFVAIVVFFVMRNNRRKKQKMEEAGKVMEAASRPAVPPYTSELSPDEKKAPIELPPQAIMAVEAPGDEYWPPPQELHGDYSHFEMEGSLPSEKKEVRLDINEEVQHPRSDPK